MSRGGQRQGAGRKSTWESGCKFADTKLIRVPAAIADEVLDFAHKLDSRRYYETVTNSKAEEELPIIKALKSRSSLSPISESSLAAKRLNLERAVLGRRRREFTDRDSGAIDVEKLSAFTKEADPDDIAWKCQPKLDGSKGVDYIPSEQLSDIQYQSLLQWMKKHGLSVQ